jgi:C1A family cysteine protease
MTVMSDAKREGTTMSDERLKVGLNLGLGWLPDYPDFRDYTPETDRVSSRLKRMGEDASIKQMILNIGVPEDTVKADTPEAPELGKPSVDLSKYCSPIENQGRIGSCTANAGVALVEYFERRASGEHVDASRLFLYKTTRNLLKFEGDTGAYLRSTMGALVLFGVPPEEYWPYTDSKPEYDEEPSAFCYAYAQNYQALQYFRLDQPNDLPRKKLLSRIKAMLLAGLPPMFGFSVFSSIAQAHDDGMIPYPSRGDDRAGGHAVMAVGFNDEIEIKNENGSEEPTVGALKIRNSWGTGWGDEGYGWLPYKYVLQGLAVDWWSLIKNEWIETGNFGL